MQQATKYRFSYTKEQGSNVIYLVEDRTGLDRAAYKAGYRNYADYQRHEKRAGNALGIVMVAIIAIAIITGVITLGRCVFFASTFQG
jgi:hypothetical protein